jgi:hypothetical protein
MSLRRGNNSGDRCFGETSVSIVFSALHEIVSNSPQPQDLLLNCLLLPQHPSVCVEEQVLKSPCFQICNKNRFTTCSFRHFFTFPKLIFSSIYLNFILVLSNLVLLFTFVKLLI